MTLFELAVAMPLVLVASMMLLSTITATGRQRSINRENAVVSETVRSLFERIRNEELGDIIALYDEDPTNDPWGMGTAPSNRFGVNGLEALDGAPFAEVGVILVPLVEVERDGIKRMELREDIQDELLGMPRDLNGDNQIDALDHTDDYAVLPVHVRVQWQGKVAPRLFEMHTVFTEFGR